MSGELTYRVHGQLVVVQVAPVENGYRVSVAGRTQMVTVHGQGGGSLDLEIGGRRMALHVARDGNHRYVQHNRAVGVWVAELAPDATERHARKSEPGSENLVADMPGHVVDVAIGVGDRVQEGDLLIVLEAMKMELRLTAPRGGRVTALHCQAGDTVSRGQLLAELAG